MTILAASALHELVTDGNFQIGIVVGMALLAAVFSTYVGVTEDPMHIGFAAIYLTIGMMWMVFAL